MTVQPNRTAAAPSRTEALLKALDQAHLLHADPGRRDPEDFGPDLSAFEAARTLIRGGSILVEHPRAGDLDRGTDPSDRGRFYRGRRPEAAQVQSAFADLVRENRHGEGTRVCSLEELERWNAADGVTLLDTSDTLSSEEKTAAGILRRYVGGQHGQFITHLTEDDFSLGYTFEVRPDGTDRKSGLYAPDEKEGGPFRRRRERLTVTEALDRLQEGRPVAIRTADGQDAEVRSFDELGAFDRLR